MITKVWIDESEEECVSCGACEAICDPMFRVPNKCEVVGTDYAKYDAEIREAADCCPAGVIRYAEDGKEVPQNTEVDHGLCKMCKDELDRRGPTEKELEKQRARIVSMDSLYEMADQPLTFDTALSVLKHLWLVGQLSAGPNGFDFYQNDVELNGEIVNVVHAKLTPTRYFISMVRGDGRISYKVMHKDPLSGKVITSKWITTKKAAITIGQFIKFVRDQREFVK